MVSKGTRQGIHVVGNRGLKPKVRFQAGEQIPASGIYQVIHSNRQIQEVTLLEGEIFPVCHKCGNKTCFELLRKIPVIDTDDYGFKVVLYEIPHPEKEKANEKIA